MEMKTLIPRAVNIAQATRIVPYLTPEEVRQIIETAKQGKRGERNALLISTLFQTGLRISEALSLTPRHIQYYEGRPSLSILGKGNKPRLVACPEPLADKLRSYAYTFRLGFDDRIFPMKRGTAWWIVKSAGEKAGISKRVYCHLFRHSDAIERLRQTGNPKSLQHHLGHSSVFMTMRYLSTLTAEDSLRIQQEVKFE